MTHHDTAITRIVLSHRTDDCRLSDYAGPLSFGALAGSDEEEDFDEDREPELPDGYAFEISAGFFTASAIGILLDPDGNRIAKFSCWEACDVEEAAWSHLNGVAV